MLKVNIMHAPKLLHEKIINVCIMINNIIQRVVTICAYESLICIIVLQEYSQIHLIRIWLIGISEVKFFSPT